MKYKRLRCFRIETIINNKRVIVGKDFGTMGNKAYYYIEVNDLTIEHGYGTQKEAKKRVEELIKEGKL